MEQVIPQSKVGNKSAAYRRMGWFMAVILVLVLCAAGSLAWFNINMAETSLKQDVERRLQFTAQNKASALSLWFNSMQNQANRLISADLFRLFASEVNGLGNDLSTILNASGDSSSGIDDLSQLASQLPLMKNLLQEFISYSGFLRARITNTDAQTYLSTDVTPPALSLEQQQGIRKTVESGKLGILPVRKTSNGLVLDLVVPIFAPQYVEGRSEKPVATLLLSLMVSSRLGETSDAVKGEGSFGVTHVFQIVGDKLQDLLPLSADIQNLPGWQLGQNDSLPFGIRKGASGSHEAVYSIGVQEVPVAAALKPFLSQRNAIVIWAVIAVVVVLLALLAVWWWLVGRNARNVSAELLQLYQISNQQKQLLDGINSALVDGIVLTDKGGMVQYANQAFAHMVGRSDE